MESSPDGEDMRHRNRKIRGGRVVGKSSINRPRTPAVLPMSHDSGFQNGDYDDWPTAEDGDVLRMPGLTPVVTRTRLNFGNKEPLCSHENRRKKTGINHRFHTHGRRRCPSSNENHRLSGGVPVTQPINRDRIFKEHHTSRINLTG